MGLEHVGVNNPGIDTLNLSQCYNVTDEGIIALTKSLHRLKYLDVQVYFQYRLLQIPLFLFYVILLT